MYRRVKNQNMGLGQALKIEMNLAEAMIENSDFSEGVRSLLKEKGKEPPKWQHKSIFDVPQDEVNWYFKQKSNFDLNVN